MTAISRRPTTPAAARLRPGDLAALASIGLRTRKLRAGLSALGIAIGVAAIVAVLGLAASSSAALLAEIQQLGTNLLTVTNGQTFTGQNAELPAAAPGMIARLPGVTSVQDTGTVSGVDVYKSPYIPAGETNALSVDATLTAQRQSEETRLLTQTSLEQGEQMKRVSSWAAILFAPSLIGGIYGMNFVHMPELEWRFGYPTVLAIVLAICVFLYWRFKRAGWL